MLALAVTPLVIEPSCEDCNVERARLEAMGVAPPERPARHHTPFVEMAPGRDGLPWHLCIPCWLDGMPRRKAVAVAIVDPPPPPAHEQQTTPKAKSRKKQST